MLQFLLPFTILISTLSSPSLLLYTPVGYRSDCSTAPLSYYRAEVFTCVHDRVLIMGHTKGLFSALAMAEEGTSLYFSEKGREVDLVVTSISYGPGHVIPPYQSPYQLITCAYPYDGSRYLIVNATIASRE